MIYARLLKLQYAHARQAGIELIMMYTREIYSVVKFYDLFDLDQKHVYVV